MEHVWSAVGGEVWYGARLAVLAALTAAVSLRFRLDLRWLPFWALLRAGVQLTVVALLLRGVLTVPWTVLAFVALMLITASVVSGGRIEQLWRGRAAAVLGVLAGSAVALAAVFALGLVALQTRYVVAIGGIVIGNTMTAATLAGRNFLRAARSGAPQVEGWFALGARPAHAHAEIRREAARESLLPNMDQTKATGLVTLPGAFVGALFGGSSPGEAARFQLVVLAGIALAMIVTAVVVTAIASRSPYVVEG